MGIGGIQIAGNGEGLLDGRALSVPIRTLERTRHFGVRFAIWAGSLRRGWNWIVSSNKPRITLPPMCPRSGQEAITVYGLQSSSTLFLFGSSQCKYVHIECQQAGLHFTSPAEENSLGVATC